MIKKLFSMMRGEPAPVAPAKKKSAAPAAAATKSPLAGKSPEALCGIDPKKMTKDEIRKRLAELFRRHNAAESSLSPELREEAAIMLDAIVACRQKYVDGK